MYPILFKLGPVTVYTYGVFVLVGIVLGYFVCLREAKKQGLDKNIFTDIVFWTLIFSFIGARFFYILVEFRDFSAAPLKFIFSRSGFVFYGGIISGAAALYFLTKKYKLNFLTLADIFAVGIPLGHAFGRLGCFSYGCCYGRVIGGQVIPIQLISSFCLFLIFFILLGLKKRHGFPGRIFLYYIFYYSVLRFIIEFARGDPRGQIGIFSIAQIISVFLTAGGIFLWRRWSRIR